MLIYESKMKVKPPSTYSKKSLPIKLSKTVNINKKRRHFVSHVAGASLTGSLIIGSIDHWHSPVVKSVILPSHAQTSQINISCTAATDNGPIADGDIASSVDLTVTTFPPEPNGLLTIMGLCDGEVVSTSTDNPLDNNGQITFSFDESICLPQGPTITFGARLVLQSTNASTECNFVIPEVPMTINCSARSLAGAPVSEGTVISAVELTISTTPAEPNGLITLEGLCDGVPVSSSMNNPLDSQGEFVFTLDQSICSSEASASTYGARITQQSNDSVVECSFGIVSETLPLS